MFPVKIKRNQIIISALVVMIAVAGYLNYIDSSSNTRDTGGGLALTDSGEISALIFDSVDNYESVIETSVSNGSLFNDDEFDIWSVDLDNEITSEPGEAVFVNTTSDTSYFVQAKLEREQSRSRQRQTLRDIINNENVNQSQRSESAAALIALQERVEKESATESMLESKGFREVYVRIGDTTVDVIVNKETLTDAEVAQIEDIVQRKAGVSLNQIRISPMKH